MKEIIAILEKYGMQDLQAIEPAIIEDLKIQALAWARNWLQMAQHKLPSLQAKAKDAKFFHGKAFLEAAVFAEEVYIEILQDEIKVLSAPTPTNSTIPTAGTN